MSEQAAEANTSVVTRLISATKRALRGEEKLWVVFWLWGVVLYVGSIAIGSAVFFSKHGLPIINPITGILGLILILVYPFMFCWALWRCAFNTKHRVLGYLARLFTVGFIPLVHAKVSFYVLFGSAMFLGVM